MTNGQIVFDHNPWPQGHPLERFRLTLRSDDDANIRLHVHAVTVPYSDCGEPKPAQAGATPWTQPEKWLDHGRAILSSTQWNNAGFMLPTPHTQFAEEKLDGLTLTADPTKKISLDNPLEDLAVGAWVLGNGIVGDHRLELTRVQPYVFDVTWRGRLRNSFLGEERFDQSFTLTAEAVRLS